MGKVREPKKTNSIEKKKKIIEAGLKVFGDKGYYNTNTAEIAKVAEVSTGIVYSYFKDKKDILLNALNLYFERVFLPIETFLNKSQESFNLKDSIKNLIEITLKSHKKNATTHEEMLALSHLDHDVHELFIDQENKITDKIIVYLKNNNISPQNVKERVHLAYNLIESLCHEYVYHKHNYIDYDIMINETNKILCELLKQE